MKINFSKNHKQLVGVSFLIYFGLSLIIAVIPAYQIQDNNAPLPGEKPMTPQQKRGEAIFIANGCVACHTQQVRNVEMDKMWGDRPSMASDYVYSKDRMNFWQQSPSLLGSERTGPDLTNVGERQPSEDWQYLHLFNPRSVVPQSIMPAYPWLFTVKAGPDSTDKVVNVPAKFRNGINGTIVASADAKALVAYLLSLKQVKLPSAETPTFIQIQKTAAAVASGGAPGVAGAAKLNGAQLFETTCAPCHQSTGEGIPGSFPPLKGSPIVNDKSPDLMIRIILNGYSARVPEFGVMPAFKDKLSDDEIAVIMTHERSSWGNNAPAVTADEVKKIRAFANGAATGSATADSSGKTTPSKN